MGMSNEANYKYGLRDCCLAVVTGWFRNGILLKLQNGEYAFAYDFKTPLTVSEVLCTITRPPSEDDAYFRVSIDHICYYAERPYVA